MINAFIEYGRRNYFPESKETCVWGSGSPNGRLIMFFPGMSSRVGSFQVVGSD